jgi:hypothetical protein
MNPATEKRLCPYERGSRFTLSPRVVFDHDCPTLAGVSAISGEKIAVDCSYDARANLALSYATSGVCIGCFGHGCDEEKVISGNEPEFARAVALLLHEAALIDRYLITSSKYTARTIHAAATSG